MTKIIEFKTKERTLAEIEEAASKEVAVMMRVAMENKELVALFNDVYIAFNIRGAAKLLSGFQLNLREYVIGEDNLSHHYEANEAQFSEEDSAVFPRMLKISTTEDGRSYLESIGMDRIRFLLASAGHTMTIEQLEEVSAEEGEE